MWWDWVAALAGVAVIAYVLNGGDDFWDRNTLPDDWDIVFGIAFRHADPRGHAPCLGLGDAGVVIAFILYAFFGEYLPGSWAHRSYETGRLVGHLYMTLEGIFGWRWTFPRR